MRHATRSPSTGRYQTPITGILSSGLVIFMILAILFPGPLNHEAITAQISASEVSTPETVGDISVGLVEYDDQTWVAVWQELTEETLLVRQDRFFEVGISSFEAQEAEVENHQLRDEEYLGNFQVANIQFQDEDWVAVFGEKAEGKTTKVLLIRLLGE